GEMAISQEGSSRIKAFDLTKKSGFIIVNGSINHLKINTL
ncbi:uncharacterized protein METZ01_LOCUS448751, partial [marine metagenome]